MGTDAESRDNDVSISWLLNRLTTVGLADLGICFEEFGLLGSYASAAAIVKARASSIHPIHVPDVLAARERVSNDRTADRRAAN